ncbi:MAG: cytochrome [Gammaproteobacteria bacterium]|nr:cytochrome [Gammaproteobacteria bacterium]
MVKQRLIAILALSACFFALCVIGLGAFTRLIDAGLGCPDWPGCYGHLIVPVSAEGHRLAALRFQGAPFITYKAWAEMIHRYFAGGLSILILLLSGFIFKDFLFHVKRKKTNLILAIFLLLLVVYQIMLGQWTVTLRLLPIIVTQHLLGGFLILVTLWLLYLNHCSFPLLVQNKQMKMALPGAIIGCFILFLQIALGAWTSTHYASLSCPDIPFCFNHHPLLTLYIKQAFNLFSPPYQNEAIRQTIQMFHRIGAFIFICYLFIFTLYVWPKIKKSAYLMQSLYLVWCLVIIQLGLGMANIIFKLPLITAVSHTLIAGLLLLAMITLIYKISKVSS